MGQLSIGIDAGGESVSLCMIDAEGNLISERSCRADAPSVLEQLTEFNGSPRIVIGIEAGSYGTLLTRKLRSAGYEVRVLDTRYVHGFLKLTQNKTDRNDARGIAEIVRIGGRAVPDVLVKSEALQMLRSELVLRHRLMGQRIALENALRGTIRLNGGKLPRIFSAVHFERIVAAELERLLQQGIDLREIAEPIVAIIAEMRRTLERANRRLAHRANDLEVCKRFMSIPGVGCICAVSFYTAIENPERFEHAVDVGPYLGLVPKVNQSGAVFRWGRISRMGNSLTRMHLVTAATSMMRQASKDSELRRWAMRLSERAGWNKARVGLARKLATVMIAMWKSGETFNFSPPTRSTNADKLRLEMSA